MGNYTASGAGIAGYNGTYVASGTFNSATLYVRDASHCVYWNGSSEWYFAPTAGAGPPAYASGTATTTSDLSTLTFVLVSGIAPAPVVAVETPSDLPGDYQQVPDFSFARQSDGTWTVSLHWVQGPGSSYPYDLSLWPGIVGYRLYRRTSPQNGSQPCSTMVFGSRQKIYEGTATSFADTGLLTYHSYVWTLAIIDAGGNEVYPGGGVGFNPGMYGSEI